MTLVSIFHGQSLADTLKPSAPENLRIVGGPSSYGKTFFVAKNGLDTNPGTEEQPFATLERAQQAVRDLKTTSGLPENGVAVLIRGGVFERNETFTLTRADSGIENRPIHFRGYPGESVRLVGGIVLDPAWFQTVTASSPLWHRLDPAAKGNMVQVDLSANGITDYGELIPRGFHKGDRSALELFFNGRPMQLARWPDRGENDSAQGISNGFVGVAQRYSDTKFGYAGTRPERWTSAEELWFHGYFAKMWADLHMSAAGIDTEAKTITLTDKPAFGMKQDQPYYAENLLEEITQPGEWYLNRRSGILYFWPPSNLSEGEVVVSLMEKNLLRLDDTSHVHFYDITFEAGRVELVRISEGEHNSLQRCVLRNGGTSGAVISGSHNGLDRCQVYDMGDAGVKLYGGVRASLTQANNYVTNTDFKRFGRWSWTYNPAVAVLGVGQIVSHNEMSDAPHSAILMGQNEHLIEYNEIWDVCKFSSDAGALYSGRDWSYRGNVIRYNFFHHIDSSFEGYGVHGVYLDDCVSGFKIFGNVFYDISGFAIQNGGGRDNLIENNIMVRSGKAAMAADSRGISRINNTPGDNWNLLERLARDGIEYKLEPWASSYPELAEIPNDWATLSDPSNLWLYPEGCVFSRNLGFDNTKWTVDGKYGGTGSINKYKEVKDNIENQNPQFVDEENLDLSLQPTSPAYSIPGFKTIPFEQIGIQPSTTSRAD